MQKTTYLVRPVKEMWFHLLSSDINNRHLTFTPKNTMREAWYIRQTHWNETNSPSDWILTMSSKRQLNTPTALDQFWNANSNNTVRHLFSIDIAEGVNSRGTFSGN